MISDKQFQTELDIIIKNALREDVGDGDHSSLACIPIEAIGKAKLLVKDNGIIAGVAFAKQIFNYEDTKKAVKMIGNKCQTESSGGINEKTVRKYADCGVNYISSGALTHSIYNMDLSLKAF